MKKNRITYYLFLLTLISVSSGMKSQEITGLAMERLQVYTDRYMYIAGERILFSAVIFNQNDSAVNEYSKILYSELITPGGNQINGGKYLTANSSWQGCLQIPEETITGIYYLKLYTRFMRNGSVDNYFYILVKIINPNKAEVLTSEQPNDTSLFSKPELNENYTDLSLEILPAKKSYLPREDILFRISGKTGTTGSSKLCLSIIPAVTFDGKEIKVKMIRASDDTVQYYPETRGISLSGRLLEQSTKRIIPDALVNLSIIGDKYNMAIRTDSSGQYFFALPAYTGNRDIFLCAEDIPGRLPVIYIENDFCSRPVNLPSPVFHLTEAEKGTAYAMAVNQKITSKFQEDPVYDNSHQPQNENPFYGDPTEILIVDKYIDLPTLAEYFNELPVEVKVRKIQGKKYFRFYSERTDMTIFGPLVLIDWVAVDDIDRVLAVSPREIDRIELVNAPYVKGNITYGGIISIVSKKNDFAGIDLPSSGTFINYKFLEDCSGVIPEGPVPLNHPDSRNTIYWDPDVQIPEEGSAGISFTAPDTPGNYIILLRGISNSGDRRLINVKFEVISE